jgi:replication-associated recombination protein RarA
MHDEPLKERYRPKHLVEVVGQPVALQLAEIAHNPRPCCLLLEGPTGVGKSTAAQCLANDLGCREEGQLLESCYTIGAGELDALALKHWFGPESPFRYRCGGKGFHCLIVEELETMTAAQQLLAKDALERKLSHFRVIVVATSNNARGLQRAILDRFWLYPFSSGPEFAVAVNDWLPTVWRNEVGDGVDMPYGWQRFGWEGEEFSARRAIDALERYVMLARRREREVVAA